MSLCRTIGHAFLLLAVLGRGATGEGWEANLPQLKVDLVKLKAAATKKFMEEGVIQSPDEMQSAQIFFQEAYLVDRVDAFLPGGKSYKDDSRFLVVVPHPAARESARKLAFSLSISGKTEFSVVDTAQPTFPLLGKGAMVYGRLKDHGNDETMAQLKTSIEALNPDLKVEWKPGEIMFGVFAKSWRAVPLLAPAFEQMKATGAFPILKNSDGSTYTADQTPEIAEPVLVSTEEKTLEFSKLKQPDFAPPGLFRVLNPKPPEKCEGLVVLGKVPFWKNWKWKFWN